MASIRLESVAKVYPNGHVAIRELDLEAEDRELLVLVGPSGCGKSTALRLVAGLEAPSAGCIRFGDGFQADRCHRQPFTAPEVRPCTMRRWNTSTKAASVSVAPVAAASTCPHGT